MVWLLLCLGVVCSLPASSAAMFTSTNGALFLTRPLLLQMADGSTLNMGDVISTLLHKVSMLESAAMQVQRTINASSSETLMALDGRVTLLEDAAATLATRESLLESANATVFASLSALSSSAESASASISNLDTSVSALRLANVSSAAQLSVLSGAVGGLSSAVESLAAANASLASKVSELVAQ